MATEAFCSFLGSWARQETEDAVAALRAASRAPNNLDPSIALLFDAVISHVQQPRSGEGVYMDNADAFELFVSSGGNVGMPSQLLCLACSKVSRLVQKAIRVHMFGRLLSRSSSL